jgi:VanZ family protein
MNNRRLNGKQINWIRVVLLIMLIGWMALIYSMSNEPYQAQDIRPFLQEWFSATSINNWLPHLQFYYGGQLITWKEPYAMLEFFMRKSAHVMEYGMLAGLWIVNLQFTKFKKYSLIISLAMVVLYAASDEWHQTFIIGRTGHAIDVAIDSLGYLIARLIGLFWSRRNINRGVKKS